MKALVTGGGGFLGGAIVRGLLDQGCMVRSLARGTYPELEALGVTCVQGDLGNLEAVRRAVEGSDVVFHVAARAGVWGSYESYFQTNVVGTEHVIAACRQQGVPRLVYTSTPSVTFHGVDEEGIDESAPYASHFLCHYAKTKAMAEQRVLEANGKQLATVALRPHLIWGPGDNHLVPRILDRARRGKLKLVGRGDKRVDSTYIDNAAVAHLQAAAALAPDAPCAGKAYFVSNGEPLPMGVLINRILAAGGQPPVKRHVPVWVAYWAGALMETVYKVLNKHEEPVMTRFVARQLSTAHWYDIGAARSDFGYAPGVSVDEGMARLEAWLTERRPTGSART